MESENITLTVETKAFCLREFGKERSKLKQAFARTEKRRQSLEALKGELDSKRFDQRRENCATLRALLNMEGLSKKEFADKAWAIYQSTKLISAKLKKLSTLCMNLYFKCSCLDDRIRALNEQIADFATRPCVDEALNESSEDE